MKTEIRPLAPDDSLRHRELMAHAFGGGNVVSPPEENASPPDVANKWGLFADGDLQAALTVVPFETHWGSEIVFKLGGIAGVATWAQARGNGYVAELLTESLRAMKERGEVVSALYPFSFAFYRKFGWDWVGEKRRVFLPLAALHAAPEGKDVRDITERGGGNVRPKIEAAYTKYARHYRGIFTADTHKWEASLSHHDGHTTYVYEYEPTGEYLLWRYDTESRKGIVREWTARTPEAFRAHLSLLHYLGTQCDTATVTVPGNSFLTAHLMHNGMETKTTPVFMGRVVDFAQAMRGLAPVPDAPNGALRLEVTDKYAPWNAGLWRVGVENGTVFCEPETAQNAPADVTLDICTLSQAFWGSPSLAWLRSAGRVEAVTDEAAFALLARLLPACPVYTLDDF